MNTQMGIGMNTGKSPERFQGGNNFQGQGSVPNKGGFKHGMGMQQADQKGEPERPLDVPVSQNKGQTSQQQSGTAQHFSQQPQFQQHGTQNGFPQHQQQYNRGQPNNYPNAPGFHAGPSNNSATFQSGHPQRPPFPGQPQSFFGGTHQPGFGGPGGFGGQQPPQPQQFGGFQQPPQA